MLAGLLLVRVGLSNTSIRTVSSLSRGERPFQAPTAQGKSDRPKSPGATITADVLTQKIGGPGCSLQEAIYSANFDDNIAPDPNNPGQFIRTNCVAGNGDDTIQLFFSPHVYSMNNIVDDPQNPFGPTGTPIIFSNITIEANGARIEHVGGVNIRAFSVGFASVDTNPRGPPHVVSGTGELTIKNAYIKGFKARGGDGPDGGGGGLGAGGAIYLKDGELTLVNSTLEGNSAIGGNGSSNFRGAGGGGGGC